MRLTIGVALLLIGSLTHGIGSGTSSTLSLIVREATPGSGEAERFVRGMGGEITSSLPIIGGFSARVPSSVVPKILEARSVAGAWPDAIVHMNGGVHEDDEDDLVGMEHYDEWDPNAVWRDAIRLPAIENLYDGGNVTVAVLDTGVSRVADLGDRVLARVDFTPDHDGYDAYGHGTHMTGIVAGDGTLSGGTWSGVAPDANIVSVKVAGWDGATDVSAVLAGLQWVVSNRDRFGIRVLNLSFGTDSTQSYLEDPLNHAIERVWASGILVVASAGNRGPSSGTVGKPGDDPFVLTVGAADLKQTAATADDQVADFSSRGPTEDGVIKPDLVAPGITIVSNRAIGSTVDAFRPAARVDDAYFKGTGTSQAAAIVSGVAALMFEAEPSLTPDIAKAILVGTANKDIATQSGAGAGLVDAAAAVDASLLGTFLDIPANQGLSLSSGVGSLEASRGSLHVYADLDDDGVPEEVSGETDVLANAWNAAWWAAQPWSAETWGFSPWSPLVAVSPGWESPPWNGGSWSGMASDASSWSQKNWSEAGWSQKNWSQKNWSAGLWN